MRRLLTILLFTLPLLVHGQSYPNPYEAAYEELQSMLTGETKASFKRAVFVTENAYLGNRIDYQKFQTKITQLKNQALAIQASNRLEYSGSDREQVLTYWSVFTILKDTVQFAIETDDKNKLYSSRPFVYDFEDFYGEKDWTKMFVTKALDTHSGNCHSLPFLYKILVEEMGEEAYLAMAPNHTYIKQWSEETGWFNTEMTSGQFPLDAWIMASGYIKLEAIQNQVYMDALDTKQSIAVALVDLAQGYQKKFKGLFDRAFFLKCLDTALEHYPNYAHARILKAEVLQQQYLDMVTQYGGMEIADVPAGQTLFAELQAEYKAVHQSGYRKMPKEMYLNWLLDINDHQKNEQLKRYKFEAPQPFKEYGYEVPTATLSRGKYQEFFDQDTIIQVGTALLDTQTGQVLGFIEYDTVYSEATLEPEVISKFLSPDPLADEREWLTPYNYVQNNPIIRIDPTGALDVYGLDKQSGDIMLLEETDDDFDTLIDIEDDAVVVDKVDKGLLKDGQNIKKNGLQTTNVNGGTHLAVNLSMYLSTELAGVVYQNSKGGQMLNVLPYSGASNETNADGKVSSMSAGNVFNISASFTSNDGTFTGSPVRAFHTHPGHPNAVPALGDAFPSNTDMGLAYRNSLENNVEIDWYIYAGKDATYNGVTSDVSIYRVNSKGQVTNFRFRPRKWRKNN